MTYRTAVLSDFESYLASEHTSLSLEAKQAEVQDRKRRLEAFPHAVVLQVAYPELDYANRWCWQQFGPARGECLASQSEYPACNLTHPHTHEGRWLTNWLEKTDYNFGYNEWCFSRQEEKNRFLEFVPQINWGEKYPKTPKLPEPGLASSGMPSPLPAAEFFQLLMPRKEFLACKKPGCHRGAVEHSVLCNVHHFEMIRNEPCPFACDA